MQQDLLPAKSRRALGTNRCRLINRQMTVAVITTPSSSVTGKPGDSRRDQPSLYPGQRKSGFPLLQGETRRTVFVSLLSGTLGYFYRLCRSLALYPGAGSGNHRRFLRLRSGRLYPELGGKKRGIHDLSTAAGILRIRINLYYIVFSPKEIRKPVTSLYPYAAIAGQRGKPT